jgi:hypothetical protein
MGVFVHGGQDAEARVSGDAVGLATDVPLGKDVTAQCQFDDRTVQIAVSVRLTLRADAVLESNEKIATQSADVIGVAERF